MSDIHSEESAIDILEKFAKDTGREINFKEVPYESTAFHPVTYHVRQVEIPVTNDREIFYISYGNSREYGKYANFSGVFFPIKLPISAVITVRNRDILDKINPFLSKSDYKTENITFNKSVVIEENDIFSTQSLFNKNEFLEMVLDIFKQNQVYILGINDVKIDFIDEIKEKSHFGIYVLDDWLVNPQEIEILIKKVQTIKNLLNI